MDPRFIYVHRSAAEWCVARGLWTVGLDYLTIDAPAEPAFPAHVELLGHDVVIIENLSLREVAAGAYELIAAPIHLQGVEGGFHREQAGVALHRHRPLYWRAGWGSWPRHRSLPPGDE